MNFLQLLQKLNQVDDQGKFPLDLAFETNQLNIAKHLLSHGANLNILDANGFSFLSKAVQSGNLFLKIIYSY